MINKIKLFKFEKSLTHELYQFVYQAEKNININKIIKNKTKIKLHETKINTKKIFKSK